MGQVRVYVAEQNEQANQNLEADSTNTQSEHLKNQIVDLGRVDGVIVGDDRTY